VITPHPLYQERCRLEDYERYIHPYQKEQGSWKSYSLSMPPKASLHLQCQWHTRTEKTLSTWINYKSMLPMPHNQAEASNLTLSLAHSVTQELPYAQSIFQKYNWDPTKASSIVEVWQMQESNQGVIWWCCCNTRYQLSAASLLHYYSQVSIQAKGSPCQGCLPNNHPFVLTCWNCLPGLKLKCRRCHPAYLCMA
jgi:hypothetical protein